MARPQILVLAALLGMMGTAAAADSVMVQCGQQYQSAKAGGTLNGVNWAQYRTDCAARLKAQPAAVIVAAPAPALATPAAPGATPGAPTAPAPAPKAVAAAPKAVSAGQSAVRGRQKACGAEWRASKASLVAQTPGLTWPKYWSQCNTRLKASGQ